ncbi:hypothetical protein [uncultured Gammaproteobacteria bacterium]|nr:hypothetical protein [uncultured Gammaproteobacteria bacterium]
MDGWKNGGFWFGLGWFLRGDYLAGKYGIFVRRSIVYIFACFTPFSCRIKE